MPLTRVGKQITYFLNIIAVRRFRAALCAGLISVFPPLHT